MRLLRDPVWRGGLVVLLRHYPAYAVAVLVGCAALALSALSGRTFVAAAEIALVQGQVDAVPRSAPEDQQGLVRASLFDPGSAQIEHVIARAMDGLDGGGPPLEVRRPILYRDTARRATPYLLDPASGDRATAVLFNATGAVDGLVPASGSPEPDGTGLWVPDTLAQQLHLTPGGPAGLLLAPLGVERPATAAEVTGVYVTDADGAPEDPTGLYRDLTDELPTWPSHLEQTAPQIPLLVADANTYRALAAGIGERSLDTWDVVPDADPVRIDDLQALVESAGALEGEVRDPDSELAQQINSKGPNEVTVFGGLPPMVDAARAGYSATIQGVSAVRVVGMGLSWLVVALAGVALLVRRRGERQVLVDQGRSSGELAALTLVEALVPVGLGLAAGLYASRPFVERIVGAEGTPVRPQDTALVGLVSLATIVVASFADAFQRHRRASGRPVGAGRRIPWRTAVVTLAGAGAVSAYAGGSDFDTVTALFPLAAVGAAAVLVSVAASALLSRLAERWLPSRLGPRLTLSRLARDPSSSTAFLAATVAFGAVGYGLLFQVSADDAASDKVAARVGAASVFELSSPAVADQLDAVADRSTLVLRLVPTVDGTTRERLLAIDSDTFGRAALWSPRFAGGRDLADVTGQLAPDGDVVPALLVGDASGVPATGTVGRPGSFEVPYRVVDRLDGVPGDRLRRHRAGGRPASAVRLCSRGSGRGVHAPALERVRRRHGQPRGRCGRCPAAAQRHRRRAARRPVAGGAELGHRLPAGVHGAGAAARPAGAGRAAPPRPRAAPAPGRDARGPRPPTRPRLARGRSRAGGRVGARAPPRAASRRTPSRSRWPTGSTRCPTCGRRWRSPGPSSCCWPPSRSWPLRSR